VIGSGFRLHWCLFALELSFASSKLSIESVFCFRIQMSEEAPAIAVTLDSNTPRLSTRRRATLPTQPATISITKPTPTRGSVSKTDVLPSDTSELVTPPLKSAGVTEPPSRRRRLNVNPASEPVPSEIQSIGTSYFAAVQTPVINAVPVSNASTTESVPIVDSSTEPASTASVAVPSPVSQPPTVCIAITSTATNPPNSTPLSSQRRLSYSLATSYQEEHKQNVYCVAFNHLDPALSNYFASVGHNCCTIYECMPGGALRPHCVIRDPETREYFYCVAWSIDRRNGIPLLCVAGQSGAIRIIGVHIFYFFNSIQNFQFFSTFFLLDRLSQFESNSHNGRSRQCCQRTACSSQVSFSPLLIIYLLLGLF
jgi:hypothetical protein